jgi:hypothetical protein
VHGYARMRARLIASLLLLASLGGAAWLGYLQGTSVERAVWHTKQAKINKDNRDTELELRVRNQKLEIRYEELKEDHQQSVAATRTELDRVRFLLSKRGKPVPGEASANTSTGPTVDEAPIPVERELFGQCAAALVDLAEEADGLKLQLTGLQFYVNEVVFRKPAHE